jgi:hypothetical protein
MDVEIFFSCKLTTYNTVVAMATMASMHISCASRVAWERGERSDGHGSTGHAPWAGIGGFYMLFFCWDFLNNYFKLFWMCFSSSRQGGIWLNMLKSPRKWHQINNHKKKYSCINYRFIGTFFAITWFMFVLLDHASSCIVLRCSTVIGETHVIWTNFM